MSGFGYLIPVIVIAGMIFIFYRAFGGYFNQMRNRKRLLSEGNMATADVISIAQTGTTINQVPEMLLSLRIENTGGQPRTVNIKQLIDLGAIPRAGDRVYVLIDPKDPDNVILSPAPNGNGLSVPVTDTSGKATNATMDMSTTQAKDIFAMSPELQQRGKLGVATIVSVVSLADRNSQITMDIDHIAQPVKRVTITQIIDGFAPGPGTRLYFIYDPQNPGIMALSPASFTNGQTLGAGSNRLDPLVLGPQLLQDGAKATGIVTSAKPMDLASQALAAQGYSKWELGLNITPQSGLAKPYQASLVISLSSKEKTDKIAREGASVPLRYDPLDPQTVSIDSIAMGYPDPYEAAMKAMAIQMQQGQKPLL